MSDFFTSAMLSTSPFSCFETCHPDDTVRTPYFQNCKNLELKHDEPDSPNFQKYALYGQTLSSTCPKTSISFPKEIGTGFHACDENKDLQN